MELNHFNEWDLQVLIRPELSRLCVRPSMTLTCVGGFMSMVVILIFINRDNP
jgi:hypothetical protein